MFSNSLNKTLIYNDFRTNPSWTISRKRSLSASVIDMSIWITSLITQSFNKMWLFNDTDSLCHTFSIKRNITAKDSFAKHDIQLWGHRQAIRYHFEWWNWHLHVMEFCLAGYSTVRVKYSSIVDVRLARIT